MPPMALDIAGESGEVTSQILEHYYQRVKKNTLDEGKKNRTGISRAREGIGLVIVEHSYVNSSGRAHPRQLGIYDDKLLPGLKKLAESIHKEGVPVGIQISHAGARALDELLAPSGIEVPFLKRYGKESSLDSSMEKNNDFKNRPQELSKEEIGKIIIDFANAAVRAQKAGFDFVEIHGAHGYLLNQFYSPLTNKRSDEYGGNIENRLRFAQQIIEAVRKSIGSGFSVFYRLGADDRMPGGNSIEESVKAVHYLEEAGVNCLDLSGGLCGYLKNGSEGFFTYMAEMLKPVVNIPVMVTGGITKVSTANEIISHNKADLVGIGRAILTDPAWARKACLEIERLL